VHAIGPTNEIELKDKLAQEKTLNPDDFWVQKSPFGKKNDPKLHILSYDDHRFAAVSLSNTHPVKRARLNERRMHDGTRIWDPAENSKLIKEVKKQRDSGVVHVSWTKISQKFTNKTPEQCRQHFVKLKYRLSDQQFTSRKNNVLTMSDLAKKILMEGVKAQKALGYSRTNWVEISHQIKKATGEIFNGIILRRTSQSLNPKLNKGKWNDQELAILEDAKHLPVPEIAKLLKSRCEQQIYNKLANYTPVNGAWSSEEDELLLQAFTKHNGIISLIASEIKTRNLFQVRQRLVTLAMLSENKLFKAHLSRCL